MSTRALDVSLHIAATLLAIVMTAVLTAFAPLSASAFIPPPGPTGVLTCPYSTIPFAAHLRELGFSPQAARWATDLTLASCL